MSKTLEECIDILSNLVAFESLSGQSTRGIVGYMKDYLKAHDIEAQISVDADGERSNIFATIGPQLDGGVVLSGHTDVVPTAGQDWATEPFTLTQVEDKLYGRGSVDMKGFLACALACVPQFIAADLKKPIHIAFSYDEETGGFGMPVLLDSMGQNSYRPEIVIVGEPTNMKLVTGHKGGFEMRTEIIGHAVHSCDPTKGANAINAATKIIAKIEELGAERAANPIENSPFNPPYPTFNVGIIEGGSASNATAGWCNFEWEYRPMPGEDGAKAIEIIEAYARDEVLPQLTAINPDCQINMIRQVAVPPLDDSNSAKAEELIRAVTGINDSQVVSFGTDAGYFSDQNFSTVVIGPGSIDRAHKQNEYITTGELQQGIDFLSKIADYLAKLN